MISSCFACVQYHVCSRMYFTIKNFSILHTHTPTGDSIMLWVVTDSVQRASGWFWMAFSRTEPFLWFTETQLHVKNSWFYVIFMWFDKTVLLTFQQNKSRLPKIQEKHSSYFQSAKNAWILATFAFAPRHFHGVCSGVCTPCQRQQHELSQSTQYPQGVQHTRASTVRFAINFCLWACRHRYKAWMTQAVKHCNGVQQHHSLAIACLQWLNMTHA